MEINNSFPFSTYVFPADVLSGEQNELVVFPFPDRFLSQEEAAEMVGMSRKTFLTWADKYGVWPNRKTQSENSREKLYSLWAIQVAMIRYQIDERREFCAQ